MQVLDDQKRERILTVAAELFATRPFHKVLLDDVAAAASVGKGTLYLYFKDKNDLYLSVLYRSFADLVDHLRERIDPDAPGESPNKAMEEVIRELVRYASGSPHLFELMRTSRGLMTCGDKWNDKRIELNRLIESIIRRGIAVGEFEDPHPELTALFIPGLVRSAMLHGCEDVEQEVLVGHMLRFIRSALLRNKGRQ